MSLKLKTFAALLTAACLAMPGMAQAQKVLKFGAGSAAFTPEVIAAGKFAELVTEKSKGKYRVDVMHSGQAGGEREIAESQQLGTLQFAILGGIVQNFDPALMIVEWDLLFKNDDHVKAVLNGPIGEKISERMIKHLDTRIMAPFMRTPRLLTTKQPVRTLADLKGMKIRIPEMAARIALWEALGSRPTPMSFPEVIPALQMGAIDGQENPIGTIAANKIQDVVKYLGDTKHLYGFMMLTVSETFWKSLPKEDQDMFMEAAKEAAVHNDKLTAESEADLYKELGEKMEVIAPDMNEWREATKDVYKKFENVEGFVDLYTEIVKLGEQY